MQPNQKRLLFCLFGSIALFCLVLTPLASVLQANELLKSAHAMGLNYCALTVLWEVFALIASAASAFLASNPTLQSFVRREEKAMLRERENATLQ